MKWAFQKENQHEQVCGRAKHRSVCEKQDVPFGWRVSAFRGVMGKKDRL